MKVAADDRYIIYCLRIEPVSGSIVYLTSYPHDIVINGNTYKSDSGYDYTGISSETGFSASTFDLGGVVDIAGLDRDKIASGVLDNARCYAFATTWTDPQEDEEEIQQCIFGKTKLIDDRFVVEMMGLIDCLNQSTGETFEALCQKEFGGTEFAGCKVDLTDWTETGTITSVIDSYNLVDTARIEAADYFTAGTLEITSGDNAGLKRQEIKSFQSGTITLFEPFFYTIEAGDTYEIIAGCLKRQEDCIAKDNIERFGGYTRVPTGNTYIRGGV